MTRSIVHALTPGDHFSPLTGSAIPTVVDGLARAAAADPSTPALDNLVLVERGTMTPRYDSAGALEYDGARFPRAPERIGDALLARLGLPRIAAGRAYGPLVDVMDTQPPSVVVAHNAPALPGMLSTGVHEPILYAHNDLLRSMSRAEAARRIESAAAVVCVSTDLAERTAARLPPSLAPRVHVVENGVDVTQFTPRPEPDASSTLRVMFVGRTIPEKGPDVLVDAAIALGRSDIEFVIVGSYGFDRHAQLSPYERSLRERVSQSKARVRFEPFVDRRSLPALLRTADIFTAPSRWPEPSGLTIGEAMATGLPVIGTRVGGIPEVLGNAGILIPGNDVEALAAQILQLANDPAERSDLGEAARQRAVTRSWSASWRQFRTVLDAL